MHISIQPEVLFNLGPIPITNSILTSWIGSLLLIVLALLVGGNYKRLPSGLQSFFEMAYEMFENLAQDALGKSGLKFVPLAVTLFLFIVTGNWLGVMPGVGSLEFKGAPTAMVAEHKEGEADAKKESEVHTPLFRGGNADLNTTFALSLIAMVTVHAAGIKSSGLKHHLAHFKNPLEIISELSKVLSFGFRLFGNIFAGEVLLGAMAMLIFVLTGNKQTWHGLPGGLFATPFLFFELFVGFIQAFVFAVLTLSFLSLFYKTETSGHH